MRGTGVDATPYSLECLQAIERRTYRRIHRLDAAIAELGEDSSEWRRLITHQRRYRRLLRRLLRIDRELLRLDAEISSSCA